MNYKSHKIINWDDLLELRDGWRANGHTVVWTSGCFDLIHVGHLYSLREAKLLGDVLVVGVNSDASVRAIKGSPRPIVPEEDRAEHLSALECVDFVVMFNELTPEESLKKLKPDVHCKGEEYAPPNGKPIPEKDIVEGYGGRVAFLPLIPAVSTTDYFRRAIASFNEN